MKRRAKKKKVVFRVCVAELDFYLQLVTSP